ncbi:MAG: ABC transporter ATP-binding protein [Flavobacterium sp.]|nr:ABC transporter ATP-binding protein [Flavobacterium sp.]
MKNYIKKLLKKNSESFRYFYGYLGYRVFLFTFFSLCVGILDGLGLTMFLPLLQLVASDATSTTSNLGNLSFVVTALESIGLSLTLTTVLLVMTFFFIMKGLVIFFQNRYGVRVLQYFITTIRKNNINRLNRVNFKYFIKSDIGQIQNTLTGETERIAMAYSSYFQAFQQAIMVLVYLGFAFFVDAKFALLVGFGGVLTNVVFKTVYSKTKLASQALTQNNNSLQGLLIQHVAHYKYLKATGMLSDYSSKLFRKIEELQQVGRRMGTLSAILKGTREPMIIIVVAVVILIQVNLLDSPLGPILISLLFFYRALVSVVATQTAWNYFLERSGAMSNLKSFEKELDDNRQAPPNATPLVFNTSIQLQDVGVNIDTVTILNRITLTIPKNKTVAFVGESGSGKTTLLNVFSGLLDISEGQLFVDGQPVPSLQNIAFQRSIGYITQEAVIFNDTIFNNVTMWAPKNEATLSRFYKAIQEASLREFVEKSADKEALVLGNNGVNLSGGQRQRVSIARELYKQPQLLLLDEATSALDSETELAIKESIDYLKGSLTIITVAHRLSTIKEADIVVFLKDGRIHSSGTFDELLQKEPHFKRMVHLQEL